MAKNFALDNMVSVLQRSRHSACSRNNCAIKENLPVATRNIRILLHHTDETNRYRRRTAVIAHELQRCGIDIAVLSETHISVEDSLTEIEGNYLPEGNHHLHEGGFSIKISLSLHIPIMPAAVCKRLLIWSVPLVKGCVPDTGKVLILVSFSARVGSDHLSQG